MKIKKLLAQPTALGPDDIATGQPVPDTDPNVVNPSQPQEEKHRF